MLLIDSDILIDISHSIPEATDFADRAAKTDLLAISAMTQMELLIGARNKTELRETEKFLSNFVRININEAIADKAVELLRLHNLSHGLQIADALIAATAIVMDEPFVTRNQRDYRFIAGLKLQSYP